jgi:mannan polymerase II complex ANP1 subunit
MGPAIPFPFHLTGAGYPRVAHPRAEQQLMKPARFQPRTRPALRWRRQLFVKIGGIALFSAIVLLLIFPSFRDILLPGLGLGFILRDDPALSTVRHYDLSDVQGTARGWERGERILFCVPLRDAEAHLPMFFAHMRNLTYPHHLIDLAFLVSDSKDNTLGKLKENLEALQNDPDDSIPFGEISLIEKDFGQKVKQDVENRHGFAAQASRRKTMAQARNWLQSAALRPYHTWVYWRDADVETAPPTILEDLMRHNKDVIVPSRFSRSLVFFRGFYASGMSRFFQIITG